MIYFVRHGETDFNVRGICAGQTDVPLNEHGLAQARAVGETLRTVDFAGCFCSPLTRARQTCAEILRYHPGLEPIYDERLRERACGQAEGQPREKIPFSSWRPGEHDDDLRALGIESVPALLARVSSFYDELSAHPENNYLVVAHGGIGKVTYLYFHGLPADGTLAGVRFENATVVNFSFPTATQTREPACKEQL